MDFTNRNVQPDRSVQPEVSAPAAPSGTHGSGNKKNRVNQGKWSRVGTTLAVTAVAVLLAALVAVISFGEPKAESKFVDSAKLQAVFLNTGQVYFGNIKSLNSKYFVLSNIYYLQTANSSGSSSTKANNVSLVKLGCELHEPYDQMVINSDQVTFWENLQDNGQVAKAVATFEKQNPQGQKCADQSSSASTNSSNTTQNAGNNSSNSSSNASSNTGNTSSTTPTTP